MAVHEPHSDNLSIPVKDWESRLPLSKLQDIISDIFENSLKVRPSLNEDYFELGGTSLGLIVVISEISSRFNIAIDLSIVMNGPTVVALAKAVEAKLNCS